MSASPRPRATSLPAGGDSCPGLAEQGHDGLGRLVGDRQGLDAELLLDLECLQLGALLGEVRVDQIADRGLDDIAQLAGAQQLVQYSQVEQSLTQTGVLKDILARMTGDHLTRAGQLIGRTAEFDSSVSGLTADRPAEWRWSFARTPATIEAEVLDSSGRVVARPPVAADAGGSLRWDGTLAGGGKAPDGAYVLRLVARDATGTALAPTLTSLGKVQDVVSREGELWAGIGSVALPLAKLVRISA